MDTFLIVACWVNTLLLAASVTLFGLSLQRSRLTRTQLKETRDLAVRLLLRSKQWR